MRIVCSDGDGKKSCVNTNYNKEVIDKVGPHFEGCEIIFPSTSNGYTITSVGHSAFYECKAKITLPESVTDIEDYAFRYYEYDGYDFQLPSKVRYIGLSAFLYSTLKRIGLNANLKNIVDNAFNCCLGLEELVIPKGVYNIGTGITKNCPKLKRLEVESGNENYSTPAGSNVIMDTKQKTILAGCSTSRIPEETYRIAKDAFCSVKFTNPTITIPESVGVIGSGAFWRSTFKRLIIKGETVEIQQVAFALCKGLERIDIYGGNVSIGRSAFEGCADLGAVWCYSHKPNLKPYARQFYDIGPDWEYGNSKVLLVAKYPDEYTDRFEGIFGEEKDLVWQNWFKTPFLYTDNYEYMRISEVHITDFDWPVAGQDADYTATSLTPYATVSNIKYQMYLGSWKEIDPKPASLGETYSIGFTITLGNAPHGQCEFTDDVKLYIDDREADLRITSSATETQMTFVVDNYVVPAPPGGVPVKSVSITVPEPVEGQPLSTEVTRP
ncbi:MAG: leucine-rich repeat domain-containing protein, partial [Bacteroidaceae bacterium]|nr:leucine-rich repeat domain-containing protein [Bacteroidaceae bacterium]